MIYTKFTTHAEAERASQASLKLRFPDTYEDGKGLPPGPGPTLPPGQGYTVRAVPVSVRAML